MNGYCLQEIDALWEPQSHCKSSLPMTCYYSHTLSPGACLSKVLVQAIWYYVQQPLASLGLLAGLAGQASREGLRGAPLLDLLQAKAASVAGNPAAR